MKHGGFTNVSTKSCSDFSELIKNKKLLEIQQVDQGNLWKALVENVRSHVNGVVLLWSLQLLIIQCYVL